MAIISKSNAARVAAATRIVEGLQSSIQPAQRARVVRDSKPFLAEITAANSTADYSWKHAQLGDISTVTNSTKWDDNRSGITGTGNAFEFNGLMSVVPGAVVLMYHIGTTSTGGPIFGFHSGTLGSMFAVKLTKDGGSAGTSTTAATWTYTAKNLDNTYTFGTELAPEKQRPAAGKIANGDGEVGLGYYDNSNAFKLYDANEVFEIEAC